MQMYRRPKIEKDGESSPDSIDTTNLKQAQIDNNKSIFSIDDSTQAPETRSSSDHDDITKIWSQWMSSISFPRNLKEVTREESEIFLGLSIIAGTIESVIRRRNEGIQNSYTKQHKSHIASQQPFNIHRTSSKFIPHPPPTRPIVDSGAEPITTQNKDNNNSHSPQNEELIQESMEKVVGGLANVSHTLEIEVEYLRELVSKVDRLEHKLDSVHHERDEDSTMKAGNGTNSVYVTGSESIDMIESKLDDRSDLMSDMSEEPKEAIVDVATSVDGNLSSDVKMDETVLEADRVFTKMDDGDSSIAEDADDNHDDSIDKTLLESESGLEMSQTEDMSGMNATSTMAERNDTVLCMSVSQVETVDVQDENMIESAQAPVNVTVDVVTGDNDDHHGNTKNTVMSVSDSRSESEMFETQDLTTTNTTSSVTETNETTLSTVVSEVIPDDSSFVSEDEDEKMIESAQALVNVSGVILAEQHEEVEELVAVDNSSEVVGVDLSVIKKDEEEAEEIVEDGMVGSNMTEVISAEDFVSEDISTEVNNIELSVMEQDENFHEVVSHSERAKNDYITSIRENSKFAEEVSSEANMTDVSIIEGDEVETNIALNSDQENPGLTSFGSVMNNLTAVLSEEIEDKKEENRENEDRKENKVGEDATSSKLRTNSTVTRSVASPNKFRSRFNSIPPPSQQILPKTYSPRFTFTPKIPSASTNSATYTKPANTVIASDLSKTPKKPSESMEGMKSILSLVDMESEALSQADKEKAEYIKSLISKIETIEKELGISSFDDDFLP